MIFLYVIPPVILFGLAITLITSYICFRRIFLADRNKHGLDEEGYPILEGKIYEPYKDKMRQWVKETRALPHTDVSITSFDGLTLRGKYYEHEKGAPIDRLMHGYQGSSERDLGGAALRCFALGRNALIVDHRGCGESEGRVITFGINESRDCLDWIDFTIKNIDRDAKIIITGLSMGAATVMITAGKELPTNVVGALADCGYSSAREIIMTVMKKMKLPPKLLYPFAKLGGRIFGHFDIDETSPVESLKNAKIPVFFIHGDDDRYVPYEMSVKNYEACVSHKKLVTVPGVGHGLAYPADVDRYLKEVDEFFRPILYPDNKNNK